jgi:hypothetical protein
VFDADARGRFSPAARCPAYTVPDEIVAAVKDKEQRDNAQVAELVRRGTATVATRTGTDGGMNPVFYAAINRGNVDSEGVVVAPVSTKLGTIPANIRLPRSPEHAPVQERETETAVATSHSGSTKVATAGSWFGGLFSFGDKSNAPETSTASIPAPKRKPPATHKTVRTASTTVRTKTPHETEQAATKSAPGAIRPKQTREAASEPKTADGSERSEPDERRRPDRAVGRLRCPLGRLPAVENLVPGH